MAAGVAGPGEEDFGQKVVHMFAKQLSNVGFTELSKIAMLCLVLCL